MPFDSAIYVATLATAFAALFVVTLLSLRECRRSLAEHAGALTAVRASLALVVERGDDDVETGVRELGRQLASIDRRVSAVAQAQSELRRQPDGGTYDDAAELARRGLDAGELISRCGIPAGEAELLVRLQQARPGPARTDRKGS